MAGNKNRREQEPPGYGAQWECSQAAFTASVAAIPSRVTGG